MAQAITVQPFQYYKDEATANFANAMALRYKTQQAQQLAAEQARLEQAQNNSKIFGESVNKLTQLYMDSKSTGPQQMRDEDLQQALYTLTNAYKSHKSEAGFSDMAPLLVSQAAQRYAANNNYWKNADDTIKELADKYKFDPKSLMAFVTKNAYDEQDNSDIINGIQNGSIAPPPGVSKEQFLSEALSTHGRKTRRDPSQLGDIKTMLLDEAFAHPEIYKDRGAVHDAAVEAATKSNLLKGLPGGESETVDATGRLKKTLSTTFSLTPFDKEVVKTDSLTGNKYKQPELNVVSSKGIISTPSGGSYMMIPENNLRKLEEISPAVKDQIDLGALDYIRKHNEEVFRKSGVEDPRGMALSVSKNNAASISQSVPGFINPFDQASFNAFKSIYAVDFLHSTTGRYKEDNTTSDFRLKHALDQAAPPQTNIFMNGQPVEDKFFQRVSDKISSVIGADSKIKSIPVNSFSSSDVPRLVDMAKQGAGVSSVTADQIAVKVDDNGNSYIVAVKPIAVKDNASDMMAPPRVVYNVGDKITNLDESMNIQATKDIAGQKSASKLLQDQTGSKKKKKVTGF